MRLAKVNWFEGFVHFASAKPRNFRQPRGGRISEFRDRELR
jgi:hypothetical protein